MTSQKAKILLVDDHTLILQGIKHVVSQMPEIEKVYTASSGTEAMLLIDMQPFDIYLLDVELPDTNGFELIDKILQNIRKHASWLIPCTKKYGYSKGLPKHPSAELY